MRSRRSDPRSRQPATAGRRAGQEGTAGPPSSAPTELECASENGRAPGEGPPTSCPTEHSNGDIHERRNAAAGEGRPAPHTEWTLFTPYVSCACVAGV